MAGQRMKRFYETAGVEASDGGWTVALDGRVIKTPAGATLTVPSEGLAAALAEEWQGQGPQIDIQLMHLTRLVNVAIDRTPDARAEMAGELARYCETDLLCFLADGPEALRARQTDAWRPVRDWAGKALGIVLMEVPDGLHAAPQPPASLEAAGVYAAGLDDFALTGLLFGTGLFGSALLGMAVAERYVSAADAYERSVLDELWQSEKWGEDAENTARLDANRTQAGALDTFFSGLFVEKS